MRRVLKNVTVIRLVDAPFLHVMILLNTHVTTNIITTNNLLFIIVVRMDSGLETPCVPVSMQFEIDLLKLPISVCVIYFLSYNS